MLKRIFLVTVALSFVFCNYAEAKSADRLVKTAKDAKIYLVSNNFRVHIPSAQVFFDSGYKFKNVKVISQKEMSKFSDAILIKSVTDSSVYKIENNIKKLVPNKETAKSIGLDFSVAVVVGQAQIDNYPTGEEITAPPVVPITTDGSVISDEQQPVLQSEFENDQVRMLQLDGTEADYSQTDDKPANIFLTKEKYQYLPNISSLLKSYPNLEIHDVTKSGDYAGCLAKSDYDAARAFAKIKGKLYIIGSINGIYACAYGLNDNGQVVGSYNYKEGKNKAFLWWKGKITKLPALNPTDGGGQRAEANDINNNGIIVGMSAVQTPEKSGTELARAVRWINGKIEDLGYYNEFKNDYGGWATDINDEGQIIGTVDGTEPFIWQDGKMYVVKNFINDLQENERIVFYNHDDGEFDIDGSIDLILTKSIYSYVPDSKNPDATTLVIESKQRRSRMFFPDDISKAKTK